MHLVLGGYGQGSRELGEWIKSKMDADLEQHHRNFPPAWGEPPKRQTRDLRTLPVCGMKS